MLRTSGGKYCCLTHTNMFNNICTAIYGFHEDGCIRNELRDNAISPAKDDAECFVMLPSARTLGGLLRAHKS